MKIKKRSIIIPAFALLIGASLAGSISGTVAWYQYSTRVNSAYVGVSGGTSGNLQIRIKDGVYGEDGDWKTRFSYGDIETYLGTTDYGSDVTPITSGNMDKEDAIPGFYANPVYGQEGEYAAKWDKALKANYVVIPLQLRFVERDGTIEAGKDAKNIAKEVFLTDLLIQEDHTNDANNKEDLSEAIRFHISAYGDDDPTDISNFLISKKGGTTVTAGKLDLDGDGVIDFKYNGDKYGFDGSATTPLTYGSGSQVAFSNETAVRSGTFHNAIGETGTDTIVYPMVAQSDSLNIVDANKEWDTGKSKAIGSTLESETEYLNVTITIWVEGWQTFENNEHVYTPIWSENFMDSKFNVGFEFAADTAVDE